MSNGVRQQWEQLSGNDNVEGVVRGKSEGKGVMREGGKGNGVRRGRGGKCLGKENGR